MKSKGTLSHINIQLLLISIFVCLAVVPLIVVFFVIPLWIYRCIVLRCSKWNKRLGAALTLTASHTVMDDIYGAPNCVLMLAFYVQGKITSNGLKGNVQKLVESNKFPELKQSLTRWMFHFFWKQCDSFKIENHITEFNNVSTREDFETAMSSLAGKPFMKGQPLWEAVAFPNYEDKTLGTQSAWGIRIHHSLGDGYSLIHLAKSLEDTNDDFQNGLVELKSKFTRTKRKEGLTIVKKLLYFLRLVFISPTETFYKILLTYDSNVWTVPKGQRTGQLLHHNNNKEIDIKWLKSIAEKHACGVTTVLAEAFTGAMRETMMKHGDKVEKDLSIAYPWPFPGHPSSLCNHVTCVYLKLPVSVQGRLQRLRLISQEIKSWHTSPRTLMNHWYILATGLIISTFNVSLSIFQTNFGTALLSNLVYFPRAGRMCGFEDLYHITTGGTQTIYPLSLTSFGYNGKMALGMVADKALFPSKDKLEDFINLVIAELKALSEEPGLEFSSEKIV